MDLAWDLFTLARAPLSQPPDSRVSALLGVCSPYLFISIRPPLVKHRSIPCTLIARECAVSTQTSRTMGHARLRTKTGCFTCKLICRLLFTAANSVTQVGDGESNAVKRDHAVGIVPTTAMIAHGLPPGISATDATSQKQASSVLLLHLPVALSPCALPVRLSLG